MREGVKKRKEPVEKQKETRRDGKDGDSEEGGVEEMWEEKRIQTCFLLISWNTMRILLPETVEAPDK